MSQDSEVYFFSYGSYGLLSLRSTNDNLRLEASRTRVVAALDCPSQVPLLFLGTNCPMHREKRTPYKLLRVDWWNIGLGKFFLGYILLFFISCKLWNAPSSRVNKWSFIIYQTNIIKIKWKLTPFRYANLTTYEEYSFHLYILEKRNFQSNLLDNSFGFVSVLFLTHYSEECQTLILILLCVSNFPRHPLINFIQHRLICQRRYIGWLPSTVG